MGEPNAIERLRDYCIDGDLYAQEEMESDLAAVDALYQAAKDARFWLAENYYGHTTAYDVLAAAVTRIEETTCE